MARLTPQEIAAANDALVRAYRTVFNSPAGQEVLLDLAPFCFSNKSCAVPGNSDQTFVYLGRNEVFRRIQTLMHMTPDQLAAINRGVQFTPEGEVTDG